MTSTDLAYTSAADLAAASSAPSKSQPSRWCAPRWHGRRKCRRPAIASSRCARSARSPMPPPPTRRSPEAPTSGRCTACRSTSRTWSIPRACARRLPLTSTSTTCRRRTSVSVARLKQAGAILIGKTTTPEFGHMPYTEAPLFGRTRNAWAADRTSGGSSGGAAVALAAGVCPIGVGTDAGGSTRIPAACNGVVGFKQSAGVVPHDTAPEAFANISSINPMARTVMDTALMLEAMAGQHPSDPYSYGAPSTGFVAAAKPEGSLKGMRIAWRPLLANTMIDSEVLEACETAAMALGQLGACGRADGRRHAAGRAHLVRLFQRALERALPRPAAQMGQQAEPDAGAADGARQGHHRRGRGPGAARAHPALPQGAGLVRPLRRDRHADADTHGDSHRGAPVRADRDRGPQGRQRAQGLVSLHPPLQPDGAPGDHAPLRLPQRRPADGDPAGRPAQRGCAPLARRGALRAGAAVGGQAAEDRGGGLRTSRAPAWPRRTCGPCPRAGRR